MLRPHLLLAVFALAAVIAAIGCQRGDPAGGAVTALSLGYQKWSLFGLLKARGTLEPRLNAEGVTVRWTLFPAGPPLLEALNAGSIQVGHTGDSPPLFAQAAGVRFTYVAASSASPGSSGILVPAASPIRSVADLKGKRVAFVKGSSAHTLVLRILPTVGLSLADVTAVYLSPSDARAALEGGSVDAWSIWDPFLAAAEKAGFRILVSGGEHVSGREFYLAAADLAEHRPDLVAAVLAELEGAKAWARERPAEVAALMAEQTGLDVDVLETAERRRSRYGLLPVTDDLVAEQQGIADQYVTLGLLDRSITVRDAVHPIDWHRAK
jgi:sulfonate transport system substrate-binding protein